MTIIAKEGEKWVVRLEEPVGRFANADIRLYARQLEPVWPPEQLQKTYDDLG